MNPARKFFLTASGLLFAASLTRLIVLGWTDLQRGLPFDSEHLKMVSPPILLIGVAFIALQLGFDQPWSKRLKGILLGLAFAIWGSETYLPVAGLVTVLDDIAMSIFVIDLGIVICGEVFKKHPLRAQAGIKFQTVSDAACF